MTRILERVKSTNSEKGEELVYIHSPFAILFIDNCKLPTCTRDLRQLSLAWHSNEAGVQWITGDCPQRCSLEAGGRRGTAWGRPSLTWPLSSSTAALLIIRARLQSQKQKLLTTCPDPREFHLPGPSPQGLMSTEWCSLPFKNTGLVC